MSPAEANNPLEVVLQQQRRAVVSRLKGLNCSAASRPGCATAAAAGVGGGGGGGAKSIRRAKAITELRCPRTTECNRQQHSGRAHADTPIAFNRAASVLERGCVRARPTENARASFTIRCYAPPGIQVAEKNIPLQCFPLCFQSKYAAAIWSHHPTSENQ